MAVEPQTNIRLLKVPISLDNKNQLTFKTKKEQIDYFLSLKDYVDIDEVQYQRKDNIINFPAHIDEILEYNYCIYQNSNYTNKWFFAFITNMTYENDGLTYVQIATDVFQTWQFDINFKECFVEREMINVNEDVPGSNLIPESLELGEIKIQSSYNFDELKPLYIIAFTGDKFGETDISQDGFSYNGIESSVTFLVTNTLRTGLQIINTHGQGDKILTVFSIPRFCVDDFVPHDTQQETVYYCTPITRNFKQSPIYKTLGSRPSSIDGYTPKNKKLLQYPFIYLGFNPQNGSQKIFRYEDFQNGTPIFKLLSEINPNPTVQFIPQNYRGKSNDNLSDNVTMNGYPNISYKNDVFNTWVAQNANIVSLQMQQEQYNYEISALKGGLGMGGSLLSMTENLALGDVGKVASSSGGFIGTALDLTALDQNHAFYIQNQMAQIEKQKLLPDNASLSGSNATLLGYNLLNYNIFTTYTIKRQFAERIDKYWDMFGYLTNKIKKPNINNRPNWNYIKTIGANIFGNIPQMDLEAIKNMFNNGITLWHDKSTFLDYSKENR